MLLNALKLHGLGIRKVVEMLTNHCLTDPGKRRAKPKWGQPRVRLEVDVIQKIKKEGEIGGYRTLRRRDSDQHSVIISLRPSPMPDGGLTEKEITHPWRSDEQLFNRGVVSDERKQNY